MLNSAPVTKDNIKVLGIIVRYKRITLGYSLRELSELAKISHTTISNFERGLIIPNKETIRDIFKVLNMEFYTEHEALDDFNTIYTDIFNHILYYEYDKAEILIKKIEKNEIIYENSKEVINYVLIRALFYVITKVVLDNVENKLQKYEVVLEFFTENQKQMFFFIKGLDSLNKEVFKQSRINFEKALKIGNPELNLLINEHLVIVLSKSDKFIDARMIAEECILAFEKKTNYIRAMRCRTRIAYDFLKKLKFEDSKKLYYFVYDFSIKYKVKDLENRCNTRLGQIALMEGKYDLCKEYFDKVTPEYSIAYYYLRFDQILHNGTEQEFYDFYNKTMAEEWVNNHLRSYNFFKMVYMRYKDEYMDKKEYERLLNVQTKIALDSDDSEMLEYVTFLSLDFYKNERQYKKAFEAAEIQLHYLKFGA